MGTGKTYSTKYLLDSNNSSGVAGQVLSTTSTGIDWVDANTVPGTGLWLANGNNIYNSNSGNVGIGVDDPQAKLEVKGTSATPADGNEIISVTNTTGGSKLLLGVVENSYGWIQSAEGGTLRNLLLNPTGGNVGIGTTLPGEKLEVAGNITAKNNADVFVNSIVSGSTTGRSFIKNVGDTGSVLVSAVYGSASTGTLFGISATRAASIITTSDTSVHPTSLIIGTFTGIPLYLGTNNLSRITILANGNVGIGTTGPDAPLHILKAAGGANIVTALKLDPDDATAGSGVSIDFNASTTNTGASLVGSRIVGARQGGNASGFLALYTSPDASGSVPLERMRIDSAGNVGIGVTGPTTHLEVTASQSNSSIRAGGLEMQSYAVNNGWYAENLYYNGGWRLRSAGYATQMYMQDSKILFNRFATGNAGDIVVPVQTMILDSNGKVGIDVTGPSAKLQVTSSGENGSGGYTNYGILTTSGGSYQATIGAMHDGDGYANLNLGSNVSSSNVFWHISKRVSNSNDLGGNNGLDFFYYNGFGFANLFGFSTTGNFKATGTVLASNNSPGYSFASDTGTGIARTGTHQMAFVHPSYTSLVLDALGRATFPQQVGIGTDTPTAPLAVHGQQKWYTTNADGDELRGFFNPGGSGDPAELYLYQANASTVGVALRATGDSYFVGGDVGIGVTGPNTKLHVVGSTRVTGDLFFDTTSTATYKIKKDGTSLQIWGNAIVPAIEVLNTGVLKLGVYALSGLGTPTHLLGVDGSGNVVKTNSFNSILDDTPASSTASGNIVNWSVSESTTAGSLYVVKTNGGWQTTDADIENGSIGMLAIALGSNATAGMLLQGFFYKASHGFTIGLPLYISNTAGAFTTTRPTGTNDYVRIIGYATSANHIYFDPDKTWVKLQ